MSSSDLHADPVTAARHRTADILRALTERAATFELPSSSAPLDEYRHALEVNSYSVLVVGEAKRGKSSFVNALIGRPLLPTDVDIATNQVFCVRRAENEAFRLRYEDDSAQEISADDLPRYGSQTVADAGGALSLSRLLRWIEVDAPLRFVPRGLNLLDTPGLGSLYAAHALVTLRFVPLADAVIFVLDSEQPIGQLEVEFLEKLLAVTPNIFFVQTKIDQHRREEWQAVQQRSEAILRERFGNRLADARIWPISSTHLMKAAATDDPDYLLVSRYKEMAAALETFLFRVAGWDRVTQALVAAQRYAVSGRATLAERLTALSAEAARERNEAQERASQRSQEFNAAWGPGGAQQAELMKNVQRLTAAGKDAFTQALRPGDAIGRALDSQISAVKTLDEANQFGATLNGRVIEAVSNTWRMVCASVLSRCAKELSTFADAVSALSASAETELSQLHVEVKFTQFRNDWMARIRAAYDDSNTLLGFTKLFEPLEALGGDAMKVALSPLKLLVPITALFFLMKGGGRNTPSSTQLKQIQDNLRQNLNDALQQVSQYFLGIDVAAGNLESRVDEYFEGLEQAISQRIQTVAAQKSQEAQAELKRLSAAAALDEQERARQAAQLQGQIAEWDGLGRELEHVSAQTEALGAMLAPVGVV